MTKLRLTLVAEYDADPKYYGTDDADEMAVIDLNNAIDSDWFAEIRDQFPDATVDLKPA